MKNTLKWRLTKLPTAEELILLVDKNIVTKEEAKEVLFNNETEEDRDRKSLEQEIKFLRETIEKLADKSRIAEVIRIVEKPYYDYRWYAPYNGWTTYSCGVAGGNYTLTNVSDTTCVGTSATNCVNISGTNGSGDSTWSQFTPTTNFTDINTF